MSSGSSSTPSNGAGGGGIEGEGVGGDVVGATGPRGHGGGYPSSSRRRSADAVWPEHFVEAVAVRVAADAARDGGRLAAAPAAAVVFQVCLTWRALSRSELLWQELTRQIWCRQHAGNTWRDEFIRLHRTGRNFRTRRCEYAHLLPASPSPDLACRRLALSDVHLAAGFADGSVSLLRLLPAASAGNAATYGPHPHRDRLGRFSQAVAGLVLLPDRLVFSSQDGDVHVVDIQEPISATARRAHQGSLVEDGTLVDFSGDGRWWVGLYAGVPGRSWRLWDARTEQLLYLGGFLTDPDSVMGWRFLTDLSGPGVGRVRLADHRTLVGCTSSRVQSLDLDDLGSVLSDVDLRRGAVVSAVDACEGKMMVVDARGVARVRRARMQEELCRFSTVRRGAGSTDGEVAAGCINWGYAVVCSSAGIRVWDIDTGEYLYSFRERVNAASVVAASNQHVVAWCADTGLHLWDFRSL